MWKIVQISDQGTSNPIVARLGVGLHDIIQMAKLPDDIKKKVGSGCFDIMNFLLQAEKSARPLIEEISRIESEIIANGIKPPDGKAMSIPGVMHLDDARTFIKFAKQALQRLAKTWGELMEKSFDGPHFQKIRTHAEQKLGADHIVTKLLAEDQTWLKEINDIRAEDEHPKSGKPFVRGFDINRLSDGKYLIDPPRFFNDALILNRLETYSHNLLTFSEEILAHTLESFFPPLIAVYTIPDDQRDPSNPVRYRIGLKPGVPKPGE